MFLVKCIRSCSTPILISSVLFFFQSLSAQNDQFQSRKLVELADSFQLTGSGSYCRGQSGLSITLSGSETGIQYQLLRNGIVKGSPVEGTGGLLSWNSQTEGVYQVEASAGGSGSGIAMEGKVVIIEEAEPVIAMGYSYYKTLSIPADNVEAMEDLTSFPLYVELAGDPDLRSISFGGELHSEMAYDMAFADQDFEPLPFELVDYNPETGFIRAWVLVPALSYDSETEIHLLFSKSGITGDPSSPHLWDSGYVQVLHLDDDLSDASPYGNFGVDSGTVETSAVTGYGRQFDGINDMILVAQDSSLQQISEMGTISLWINFADASDGDHQIVLTTENRFDGDGFEWASQASGNHFFYPNGYHPDNYIMVENPFTDSTWHYLAVTLEYSTREVSLFVDGVPLTLSTENTLILWTRLAELDQWLWGGNPDRSSRYFLGAMDEIRVQNRIRTAGWLRTEYLNQTDPEAFFTLSEKDTLTTYYPVCSNESSFHLPVIQPLGGTFGGPGVQGDTFHPSIAGAGLHGITYSITSPSGCTSQASDTIQVLALPGPWIAGPDSLCPGTSAAIYSTDSVSGNIYQWTIYAPDAEIISGQGTHRIIIDWGESSGNIRVAETNTITACDSTTALFPVFIGDARGPVMECPEDQVIELDTSCSFYLPDYTLMLNTWDDCDTLVIIEQYPPTGTLLSGSGTRQELSLTSIDQSGNETRCTFNVILVDLISPLAEFLSDTTIVLADGVYEADVILTPPQFSDNCGILSINNDYNGSADASGIYPYGITEVRYTVSDVNDNISTFLQRVIVEYENAPESGLIIPEALSPNGDGLNDHFRILGLEAYPDNRLDVYNVHGIKVFSMKAYDSSWDGTSINRNDRGKTLPSGTYYYLLHLEEAGEILKGFVYLRRE